MESASLKEIAEALRGFGLKAPIAGVSHWRREADFAAAQQGSGIDLVDDRLYWASLPFLAPARRSIVWSRDGGLLASSGKKRKPDRPYVVGQWCDQTFGAWALPYEGADLMLAALTASAEDWDALARRGVFAYPEPWGASATGSGGGSDIFQVPEAINGNPPVYALLPHAASMILRPHAAGRAVPHRGGRAPAPVLPGWDPRRGRAAIDSPHTVALAGWSAGESVIGEAVTVEVDSDYAVVAASSLGKEPIATARRLLVTAVARVEPTGFKWVDEWRREVADIGDSSCSASRRSRATVEWRRKGEDKAFALDAIGKRGAAVPLIKTADGVRLAIDARATGMHWELVADE